MNLWEHVAAITGAIGDPDLLALTDPINDPSDDQFPYCFVSLPGGRLSSERLASVAHRADFAFQTTLVALTPESAGIAAEKLYARLALQRLAVPGRITGRCVQLTDPRIDTQDRSLPGRVVTTVIDQWSFTSAAA